GVFRLGGVLVGTYAFTVLGNVLGARWDHAALRTQDIDLAADSVLGVAVPADLQDDVPSTLERLEMGFLPVPPLNSKAPSTSFRTRGGLLRLDLLTVVKRANRTEPVFLPQLKASAMPLPFMDYLLEEPIRAAVVDRGGVLVNVPSPARFALHKLLVMGERSAAFATKAEKDFSQSAQMLTLMVEDRPGDLQLAWEALRGRAGASKRITAGLASLDARAPDVSRAVHELIRHSAP
ncbi:MAG: nucleotidyltransferase domain-containing protein, partial [Deltaproteobacteria bacterium]|nr:nucleotidyltransferase domain-containing protein [Deltaproteobacteria bacterium]